jgi:hypothetical protein
VRLSASGVALMGLGRGSAVGNYWRGGLCREVLRLSVASSTLRPRDGAG